MIKWIHHLLNPHCEFCKEEYEESKFCKSCETLRIMLDQSNAEKRQLLNMIMEKSKPEAVQSTTELKPIAPKYIPWKVQQQMLEQEDRQKARILREQKTSTEDLEKEVLKAEKERESAS